MFIALITSKGFEETVKKETVAEVHRELLKILQELNIDFMPHQLGKERKMQIHYKIWKHCSSN